jgi:hypothetical protein
MKRFVFATLAALAAMVASEQQAKAWFNIGVGSSTQANLSWGGWQRCGGSSEPWPHYSPGYPSNNWYGPAQSGPGGYGFGGAYAMPWGYPQAAPGSGYVAPMPGSGSGSGSSGYYYMPVPSGYVYTAPYYFNGVQHAYYEMPAYWYGR